MACCSFCKADPPVTPLKTCVCGGAVYCSKECQRKDWTNHRASCHLFTVREIPGKGRGLFATRKINPGKIILEEGPLLTMKDTIVSTRVSLDVFERFYLPTIDGQTKARILQLHDPVDNFEHLTSEKVDIDQLIKENPDFFELFPSSDESCKILRIFANNCITVCQGSDEVAIYSQMSLINHSCDPNVSWTRVRGDVKRKQVRAMKVIEKGEELLATYGLPNFASRDSRQRRLLSSHQFLCQCSQCSLEGEALQEDERMRAEIREKKEKIQSLKNMAANSPHLFISNLKKAVCLSQEVMERVRKLNLQPQIFHNLLTTALTEAWFAKKLGLTGPDPDGIKQEALEFAQKFGESAMILYNNISKDYP